MWAMVQVLETVESFQDMVLTKKMDDLDEKDFERQMKEVSGFSQEGLLKPLLTKDQ